MIRKTFFKRYLSVLFSSIYLFAFLFATNIHQHNSGYYYKNFNFKNSSSLFSKQSGVNNAEDCLACQFASSHIILPTLENFVAANDVIINTIQVLVFSDKIVSPHFSFHLRGPPSFI